MRELIQITLDQIDIMDAIRFVQSEESGGIDVFIGTVRNQTQNKKVMALEFEVYDKMAVSEIQKITKDCFENWPIQRIAVIHAKGKRYPNELAVVIAVSAAHRDAAFKACRYIIDTLKQTVPIWKREEFHDGDVWVAAHP